MIDCIEKKEDRRLNNPPFKSNVINPMFPVIKGLCTLHKDLGITMTDLLVLMILHDSWCAKGHGLNVHEICKLMDYRSVFWSHVQFRMIKLRDNGFVDIVGTGINNSILYAPSKDMIQAIDAYYLSKAV